MLKFEKGEPIPTGCILMWHGAIINIPTSWFICDGNNGTPDLRAKFIRGAPAGIEAGTTGGEDTHTLTINEMPSHRHSINFQMLGGAGSASLDYGTGYTDYTNYVGGGTAHNNMPSYYEIIYIMKG